MGINVDNLTSSNNSTEDCVIDLNDTSYLQREAVQAQTALWNLYISITGFIPALLAYIVFGSMSDRIGRRFLFILPPIGSLFRAALIAAVIKFELPIWVFIFNALEFMLGSFELLTLASFAYLADTTSPKYLAMRMTIIQVIIYLSGGVSDLVVGYFINAVGYLWPTLFVCCGMTLTILYAVFLIPETVVKIPMAKKIQSGDFTRALKMYKTDNGSGRLWKLRIVSFAFFIAYSTHNMGAVRLMIMNAPLCWGPVLFGYFEGFSYGIKALGILLIAALTGGARIPEGWLLLMGLFSSFAEAIFIPFVQNSVMMFFSESSVVYMHTHNCLEFIDAI